ncbi:uncharacterized protein LOC110984050, partial [Acanthaster planci]|uniref:Uncharacterized protein LOC110984050 n=1 Tax=Acanthaster planci TaxID=133434 RepID=A0A8B7Z8D7_ACAPL
MTCFGKQRGLYLYNFKMGWSGFPMGILAFAICLYPIPALEGANPNPNPHPLRRGCAQMRLGRDGRPQLDLPDIPRAINATFGKFTEAWLEGRGRKSPLQISIVQSLIEESLPKLALIDAYGALASEVVAASKIWGGIVQNATMEYFRDSMAGYQPALTPPPILGRNESLDHHEIPMERNSRSAREPEPTQPTEEQAEYGFHPPEMEDFNISKRVELLQKLAYYGVLFFTTEEEQTIDEHLESGSRVALFEHFLNSLLQAQISDVIMHAVGSGEMGIDGDCSLPDNGDSKGLSNNTDMGGRGGEVLTRYLTGENYSALYGAYGTVSFNVTGGLEFESLLKTLRGQVDEWIGQDNPQLPALYNVNCWAGEDRSVGCKVCPQKDMSRNATTALDSLATRLTVPFSLLGIDLEEVSGGIGRRYRRWIAQMRTRVPTTDGTDDETPDRGEDVTQDPGDGETPDDGGENPDTGGENPVTTGENPDTGGENPDTGGENPDTGGENPDTGGENPDTGGENPDTGGENPDTGGENPDTGGENPDTGGENPDMGDGNPDGQEEVPRVVAAITGPKEIPSCGDLVLHGSASQGPSLSYTWEMSPRQQTSEALMARLKTVNDANEPYLKLNGGLLTEGVEYTVTLTVSPQGSRHSHSISHRVRRLSEASKKPSLVLQHRGLSENNNILASKTLLLWADVHFYDSCIESSSVKFVWSARQGSQPPITGLLQRGGRNQRIPAGQLPVGEPVTISVEIPPNGETVLESVTAEVTVTVERSPLIVSIKGGSEITAGTDSQANLVLDASESHDPDDEEARLDFSWTCRLTNPAKSECPGQLSPSDRSTLSVTLNNTWDDPNPYVFTVTVRRRQRGAGHATASVIVHVKRGDPPQIELSAPFQGKFQPSRDVVVTAQISNAALGSSVEWLVLKGGVQQTVQGATSTSVSRGTAIRASFAIPKGMLAAGSDYTVKANVKDFPGQVASSASTTITVFKGVSGCTVQLQSQEYRVFEIVDISVVGCTGTGKLTYKAFVAPTADSEERQVLTTVAGEQSRLNQDRAVKVAGAATVAIIVRVEDETGSWAEFAKSDVPQVEEPTAGGIEAVKNTREKLVQTVLFS